MADNQPMTAPPELSGPPTDRFPVLQAGLDLIDPPGTCPATPADTVAAFQRGDGTCSMCGDPWAAHWDPVARRRITGDEWHARDMAPHAGSLAVRR